MLFVVLLTYGSKFTVASRGFSASVSAIAWLLYSAPCNTLHWTDNSFRTSTPYYGRDHWD